jgi:hypothetical protein
MRRIAVTSQAEAIAATLPLGVLAVEPNVNDMRGPGESYLDVITRLTEAGR